MISLRCTEHARYTAHPRYIAQTLCRVKIVRDAIFLLSYQFNEAFGFTRGMCEIKTNRAIGIIFFLAVVIGNISDKVWYQGNRKGEQ